MRNEHQLDQYEGCGHMEIDDMPTTTDSQDEDNIIYRYCPECGIVIMRPSDQERKIIDVNDIQNIWSAKRLIGNILCFYSEDNFYSNAVKTQAVLLYKLGELGVHDFLGYKIEITEKSITITMQWLPIDQHFTVYLELEIGKAEVWVRNTPHTKYNQLRTWLQ